MRVSIVRLDTVNWKTLSKFATQAIKEGTPTHVYNDGIMFTRELIKQLANPPEELVVLVGREEHVTNAYRLCRTFQETKAHITELNAVLK